MFSSKSSISKTKYFLIESNYTFDSHIQIYLFHPVINYYFFKEQSLEDYEEIFGLVSCINIVNETN